LFFLKAEQCSHCEGFWKKQNQPFAKTVGL